MLQEPSQCPSWWQLHRSLGFLEVVSRTQMPNITVPSFRCHSLPRLPCNRGFGCRLLFPPAPCLLDLRMLQVSVSAEDRGAQQAPGMVLRAANCIPLHSSTLLLPQGIGGVSDPPAYWPRICYGAFGGVRKLFEFSSLSLCQSSDAQIIQKPAKHPSGQKPQSVAPPSHLPGDSFFGFTMLMMPSQVLVQNCMHDCNLAIKIAFVVFKGRRAAHNSDAQSLGLACTSANGIDLRS